MNQGIDAAANALERMSDALFVVDERWRFIYLNPRAATLLRRAANELLGTVLWEQFPEAVGSIIEQQYRRAAATGEPVAFEACYPPLDGWYEVRAYPGGGQLAIFFRDITERRRMEAALRESEQRLRLVMESLPVGLWVADRDGNILSANAEARHIWAGMRAVAPGDTTVYRGWWSAGGQPIAADEWAMARALKYGEAIRGEIVDIEAFDGTHRTIRNAAVPIRDEGGDVTGVLAINEDITEQRRAEQALETTHAHLQQLFDAGLLGIAIGDRQGTVQAINDEMLRIIGRSRAEMMEGGLRWTAITPPEHLERDRRGIAEATVHGRCTPYEKQFIRPDGSRVWVMMGLLSMGPDDGIAFAVDIQARKEAELEREAVLERERVARAEAERERQRLVYLQRLTAALAEALTVDDVCRVVLDEGLAGLAAAAGLIALHAGDDPGMVEIVRAAGYPPDLIASFQRMPLAAALPITDAVRTGTLVLIASPEELAARYPAMVEIQRRLGHAALVCAPLIMRSAVIGAVGFSLSARLPFTPEEQAFFEALAGLCGNALDRARLYDAAQRARAAAEAANRAKDEFLSIVSHELRTPLTPIAAYAEMLRDGRLKQERIPEALDTIIRNVRLESRLVADLLDTSRIVTGKLAIERAPLDLAATVAAAISAVHPAAVAAGVSLAMLSSPAPLMVDGDAGRLEQAVSNLLINAVKFTPAGGRVEVALHREHGDAAVTVRDTGIGIDAALLPHVFEPFRQGQPSGNRQAHGLGLGLAIVRYLVEQHGGRVAAASDGPGRGATFTILLPCAGRQATPAPPAPPG